MIRVTCAIIIENEKVLAVQRSETMPNQLQWEFPGGKIHDGESEEACLVREIKEELDITVHPGQRLTPSIHHYADKSIELIPYLCNITDGTIVLKEHKALQWIERSDLLQLNWCEADIPIAKQI